MSYSFVVPEELLADLVLIRAITKESIRSLIIEAIHERSQEVIAGMKTVHSSEYINNVAVVLNEAYSNKL